MQENFPKKLTLILTALIVALGFLVSFSSVNAQTKKKTTKKRPRAVVVPTPVPQPVVISQAEQYQNQNQQIIVGDSPTPTFEQTEPQTVEEQPETFDEKLDKINRRLEELSAQSNSGAADKKSDYDTKQKRLALNLEILSKAEQRAESLRKQLFELVEKENNIKTRLETLDFDLRPEIIERQVAMAGSLRPEELRDMKRRNLEAERRNLESLLTGIQTTRSNLELNVQRADQLVEKLRFKLEKDIDDALTEEPK